MQTLTEILKRNPDTISNTFAFMCKLDLTNVPIHHRGLQIFNLILLIDLTLRMGWAEHTSDWDPYLKINNELVTLAGYSDIGLLNADKDNIDMDMYTELGEPQIAYVVFGEEAEDDTDYKEILLPLAEVITIELIY